MRRILYSALSIVIVLPLSVHAENVVDITFSNSGTSSFVSSIVSKANGGMTSETVTTSESGTFVGGKAVSTGDTSAEARVRNIVTGGNGTTVRVEIQTESDGTIEKEVITRRFGGDATAGTSSSKFIPKKEIASTTKRSFFSWFDKHLVKASSTPLFKQPSSTSTKIGNDRFKAFFERLFINFPSFR